MPNAELLRRCAYVFVAEMVIDVIKHAVLGKFNEVRPGVYREFMKVRVLACCAASPAAVVAGAGGSSLFWHSDQQAPQVCIRLVGVSRLAGVLCSVHTTTFGCCLENTCCALK